MKEVKTPKKPLAIYYAIVLLVLMLLNFVLVPWMSERQVKEVDYGTFMSMTEDKDIGRVDVESNQIIFTDKDEKQIYKTGLMNDPDLTQRLYDAGAEFSSEIVEQASPLLSFLLSFVLPIVLFVWLGNFMNKKLIEKAGGANSMMFGGVGKSNAKVYVQSTHGIRFADVAGEDEAKENLQEIVDYLHDPKKYEEIGASMPKGILLVGPPGTQDHAGKGRGGRIQRAVLLHLRLGVRGDVRGHGRLQSPRFVQAGQGKSPLHCVHRRDRRHWPEAQQRPAGRQ